MNPTDPDLRPGQAPLPEDGAVVTAGPLTPPPDSAGTPVANLTGPGYPGLNRVVWDLKSTSDLMIPYGGDGQKLMRPGTYTVTLTGGEVSQSRKLAVTVAPGIETR